MTMSGRFLAAAVIAATLVLPGYAGDDITSVSESDPVMNAAIEKARATLPEFWAHLASPGVGETDFNIKLAISDGESVEHFWCDGIEGDSLKATCSIANDAVYVHTVKFGDRVDIDPAQISDWMYFIDGRIKGAQTLRALLPRLSEEDATRYRAMLIEE